MSVVAGSAVDIPKPQFSQLMRVLGVSKYMNLTVLEPSAN